MAAPILPQRFPCWVKAVYSWGGETKRDLGFVEGDLIECLNAGDGMWWTGRLKRDRRMIGLFPSNFVQIMDEGFNPTPHRSSPLASASPSRNCSLSTNNTAPMQQKPSPHKSLFRKPFKSYGAAGSPVGSTRDGNGSPVATPSPPESVNRRYKPRPFSSMKQAQPAPQIQRPESSRPPSPTIPEPIARAGAAPSQSEYISRVHSSSPVPHGNYSRAHSPIPQPEDEDISSSPPPPPPAHGTPYNNGFEQGYNMQNYTDYEEQNNYYEQPYTPRSASPALSGHHSGMTPSPLRDAINDVMSSLEGMSTSRDYEEEQEQFEYPEKDPPDMWSPEAFNEVYSEPPRSNRPHTSLGMQHEQRDMYGTEECTDQGYYSNPSDDGPSAPAASYVERMESRLRNMHLENTTHQYFAQEDVASSPPPAPPPKGTPYQSRPASSMAMVRPESAHGDGGSYSGIHGSNNMRPNHSEAQKPLKTRKSAYELGREKLGRTFTSKSSVTTTSSTAQSSSTNNSQSTQATSQSIMSGHSAGGFSATSAGSLARRKFGRSGSIRERAKSVVETQRPATAMSGISYQPSDQESHQDPSLAWGSTESAAVLGGLSAPTPKKRGFLTKMLDSVKTGTASARSNMAPGQSSRPQSRQKSPMPQAVSSSGMGNTHGRDAAKEMGLGGNGEWVQMRRDVNRSNSLSHNERTERIERCQMMDIPVLTPADVLNESAEGDEAVDGSCVSDPTDFSACNLALVDKSARFVNNLPVVVNSTSLAQGYLCRPYRSDVQRLRAIFTWVAERVTWEEDFEGDVDTRRVVQTRRGCSQEIAVLVSEMCRGVGIQAEVIRGHLKAPGEILLPSDFNGAAAHPNHWWNAVVVDGEWRIMDCSLASPTNPKRATYTKSSNQVAESWWFLARPMEICYTHVPLLPKDQHIVPPLPHDILMALPVASPGFFKNHLQLWDFDTSLIHLDALEMAHIQLAVPEGIECTAEVEARVFARDPDGDFFESGDVATKRALAQGEFVSTDGAGGAYNSFKRYTIKAVLPSSADSSSNATLKIYAGKRGLQHSITSNPHNLALSLPLSHSGPNPAYEFCVKHPTPHALRHELYITGPLCKRLVFNSTFVFGVRQHRASTSKSSDKDLSSSSAISRPGSAMSMASASASGSNYSDPSTTSSNSSSGAGGMDPMSRLQQEKPAKLAIQSPSGKILRMTRKMEHQQPRNVRARRGVEGDGEDDDGGVVRVGSHWETIIKIGERGVWRGLVLADRSARWCVFAEWDCA